MARKIGSRYTAQQVLGRGSAGTVWLGEGPDGPVAIKLLREDLASDQELVGRFVQERTALLSLDHPNIVGIRDLVVDGTDLALVMRLVRGTDLRSRLEREHRLTPEAAVAIVADVADGLTAAHAAGVVHRDVKPENIMLDSAAPTGPGGAPPALLTDFGIARLVDSPRRTRATRIIGTPDYLAPEIIEGLPPRASVDIYALATVLYELLAGFAPFGGGHPGAVLRRHVTESVAPLPGVPDELWQILSQCLAKAPASRLTAGELGERLRGLLPRLAGLPALDVDVPDADDDQDDEPYDPPPYEPVALRGAVPLVRGAAPDSSRDTHTSIRLPTAEELGAYGAGGRPAHRGDGVHRAVAAPVRRRRMKLGAAAAAAVVLAGIGGIVASRDADARTTTREDPGPTVTPAPEQTPVAPLPQGTAVALPSWSEWEGLPAAGVELLGGPRTVTVSGTAYVFARGADKNVWYITRTSAGYGAWKRLSGIGVADDPAVVSARAGQLDVFVLGTDGLLYRRTLSSGWSDWYQVDERTRFDSAPAAASSAPGRIDLIGRAGGDLVTASWLDGRWNAWAVVATAGRVTGTPGLISREDGRLDAFAVRAADGAVLHLPYANGAWRPYDVISGIEATGRPEPAVFEGRLYVIAPTRTDGIVQAMAADGVWVTEPLPGATGAVGAFGRTLYARTAAGSLSGATAGVGTPPEPRP